MCSGRTDDKCGQNFSRETRRGSLEDLNIDDNNIKVNLKEMGCEDVD
jgi:hypothetical protein